MAAIPPSGSSTSPLPVRTSRFSSSATIINASRLRRYLSMRQSLVSSTAARRSWPLYCSSFFSSRSNSVKASAVAPAKPATTFSPSPIRRTLRALGFITVLPMETCPSPAMTVAPPRFTPIMVVECHWVSPWRLSLSSMRAIWGARGGGQAGAGPQAYCPWPRPGWPTAPILPNRSSRKLRSRPSVGVSSPSGRR